MRLLGLVQTFGTCLDFWDLFRLLGRFDIFGHFEVFGIYDIGTY